jgi:phospholipid/cholesterol/gamma-HCH transport system substrate-binding protein
MGETTMSQAMNKLKQLLFEVVVGSFMFAVLIGLAIFTIVLSRDTWWTKGKVPFEVVFEHVMGLRDGDNVVVRGMEIGKVKKLILKNDGVHVICTLRTNITLKTDYKIEVIPTSVLGGRYLQITEGTNADIVPQDVLPKGKTPFDLMALVSDIAADVKKITGNVSEGKGTLGKLINDDSLYQGIEGIVSNLKYAVGEGGLLSNVEEAVSNFNQIAWKVNSGTGTLGKLVNDASIYQDMQGIVSNLKYSMGEGGLLHNVEEAVSNFNQIAWKVNSGTGTLAKLVNDPTLYDEAKKAITEVRNTIDDARETSPIVTFASIFFGAF